jgi:hypothetical protein
MLRSAACSAASAGRVGPQRAASGSGYVYGHVGGGCVSCRIVDFVCGSTLPEKRMGEAPGALGEPFPSGEGG